MSQDSPTRTSVGSDVFVSYASQDVAVANSIVESLENQGLKCWIAPRDVKPGAQYADAIVRAINDAKAVVLVMSASAIDSSHVAREVERGASKRKPIIPFRIDNAPLNPELEYFLSNSQWIDVANLGMPAALSKLKVAVGQGSEKSQAAPTVAAISDKSIAVLPFADMSEKKDQEYFADGMAEEIIGLLVRIPGLKVIGRTSSFQFKGKSEDLRSIGTQLRVAYLLEGSVRKSGDRLRVVAQLIDSRDGTHLWSQTYDRDLSDVLKMQDEIAAALVRAMQIEVSAADFVSRPALRNTQAYTLFLQGLHAFERYDRRGFEQAATYYQRALDLDSSMAAAAVGLAAAYGNLGAFGFLPPAEAYEQARQAAALALKLDPKSALAHALLGSIHGTYDWDWTAADRELKQALALAPSDAAILALSAYQSVIIGRWDAGLKLINTSLEEDPLNPMCYLFLHYVQLRRGRLAEAEAAIRRCLEISPTFNFARYNLGVVLLTRSEPQAALAEFLKEPADAGRLVGSALAFLRLGHKAESDALLAQLLTSCAPYIPSGIAAVYAFRGEPDQAFEWLDRAYAQRDPLLYRIKFTTEFDKLHDDPRYKAFLKKMNLPEG